MAGSSHTLFNAQWYLSHYPDVAAAVEQGTTSALQHFELFGKAEGRSPGPLFNATEYLRDNSDVAAAVDRGETNAYDHFVQHGAAEDRSPLSVLDMDFYLALNPDVAAAVDAGETSAVEHLLLHGLEEGRQILPFLNLQGYLDANPDVAKAVQDGGTDPLSHLLQYGIAEGRLLSNGVDLAFFARDPSFNAAIKAGAFEEALARVSEVAPFLPAYTPPTGWHPAPDTPIPQGFVPPAGQYLVVPEGVIVPPDTALPDAFGPQPDDGGEQPQPGRYDLTPADETINGTAWNDHFHATAVDSHPFLRAPTHQPTLNDGDVLDGKGGWDILHIDADSYQSGAHPTLRNIEQINNSFVDVPYQDGQQSWVNGAILDLKNATGVKEVWTDFTGGTPGESGIISGIYHGASLDTTFGVRGVDSSMNASIDVSLLDDLTGGDDTLKIAMDGRGGALGIGWNDNDNTGIETVAFNVEKGNETSVGLADYATVRTITVTGSGDLDIDIIPTKHATPWASLTTLEAGAATGDIDADMNSAGALRSVTLGSGDDTLSINQSTMSNAAVWLQGGKGHDTLNIASNKAVDINAGVYGFEVVNYRFDPDPSDAGIDASKLIGTKEIWQENNDTNVIRIGEGQAVGLRNTDANIMLSYKDGVGNATVEFDSVAPKSNAATVLLSGTDLQTVSISGSLTGITQEIRLTATTDFPSNENIVDTKNITTLNVDLETAAKITLINFDKLETFNAADSTGDITAQLVEDLESHEVLEHITSVTLGSGNDSLAISAVILNGLATLQGGEGEDTLSIELPIGSGLDPFVLDNVSGFEHLTLVGANGAIEYRASAEDAILDIDLLGMAGSTILDYENAGTYNSVNVDVGSGDLTYTASQYGNGQTFSFSGNPIGNVVIDNFVVSQDSLAITLDLSAFADIHDTDDLGFDSDGVQTVITSSHFGAGSIILMGGNFEDSAASYITFGGISG